ncbi:Retrovirus-related Pol polyprotein LINE-1 [Gossypium australe]|uniref:Retrovirus-related Pol polyprotein LINE-1 n=1 Tax=Gossypium australe TaxID=47621 RepID=A0A5B6WW65_9ROSI|nr:Retrovirus-related Pol polyprotein LINE-1 [Gossypium australe]
MKNTKSKKGWMAVKVDMEKAYDRELVCEIFGISCKDYHELCFFIIHAITLEWFSHGDIYPNQMCPSRHGTLGHLIDVAVKQNCWEPLILSRRGPGVLTYFLRMI